MEKTKKTGLILILSSDTVDTYVNVICHTYYDYNIQEIHFCHISGASTGIKSDQAEELKNKIDTRLRELAEGGNTLYDKLIKGISFKDSIKKIPAEDIGSILTQKVKSLGGQKKCLIDITTTTKSASQFVLAGCLIYGLRNLYEFHLYKRIDKDKKESSDLLLYHHLKGQGKDYQYVHLSDTLAIRRAYNSLSRKIALSMAAVVVSMLVLIISVTWISTSSVSIASILASAASLATVISLGLQMKEFTS